MTGDGQARGGTAQRLSLACPHHLGSSPVGDSQVHPTGSLLSGRCARWAPQQGACLLPSTSPPPPRAPAAPALTQQPKPEKPGGLQRGLATLGAPSPTVPSGWSCHLLLGAPRLLECPAGQARLPSAQAQPWGLKALQPWVAFLFWTHTLLKEGSHHPGGPLFLHRTSRSSTEKSLLSQRDGCRERAQAGGRTTRPTLAPQTCLVRVASPAVLLPLQWGVPAQLCTPSLCTFWGFSGLGTSLPTAADNPGRLLVMGSPPAPFATQAAGAPLRDAGHAPGLVLLRMLLR